MTLIASARRLAAGLTLATSFGALTLTIPAPASAADIPATPEPGVVKMSTVPWLGYGQWFVAEEKGHFKEVGLEKVEITNLSSVPEVFAAFNSGQVDVMNISTNAMLLLNQVTDDLSVVMLLDFSLTSDAIIAGEGIEGIGDLKGRQVAYEEGDVSDVLINYALRANDMTIDDIVKVPMPPSQAGGAVIAGQVPAAVTYEPYLTAALNQDPKVKIIYSAGENPGLISDVLVVRTSYLEAHPGQVLALLKAWDKALTWYEANVEDGRAIIAKAVGATPEELTSAFDGVKYFGLARNASELSGDYKSVTMPKVVEGMVGAKQLPAPVDGSHLVDARFVAAAVAK